MTPDRGSTDRSGPDRSLPDSYRRQLEQGYEFGGVMTFAQRPLLTDPADLDRWQPDAALVGAPFDLGTTNRPGARFGPRALRSNAYEIGSYYHVGAGLDVFDHVETVDYGDAACPRATPDTALDNIRARVADVASRGIVPLVIGGDHTVTWPAATAVADCHGHGNVGIVHLDAHADTGEVASGGLASHGTPMRRLITSGAVPGPNFVQVGLRGYWPEKPVWDWMRDQGMRWHLMDEIVDRGFDAVMDDAVSEALDAADLLYISVDIDAVDPGFAPGTGTPEPGGLTPTDVLRMIRRLAREHRVVGMDVVELCPAHDHADITVNLAHRMLLSCLTGLAERNRDAAGNQRPGGGSRRRPEPGAVGAG